MSKVIRLNNRNIKLLEEVRKAYINYFPINYIYEYATDNDLITIALTDTLESLVRVQKEV